MGAVDRGSGWERSGSKALDKDTEPEQRAPGLKTLNRNRSRAGMKSKAGGDKGGSKIPISIDAAPREALPRLAYLSLMRVEWAIF